jgi:signal transduction histidine kinase
VDLRAEGASRLDAFFQAAPIGMAQVDTTGALVSLNPAFARLLGFEAPELQSRRLGEISPLIEDASRDILESGAADREPIRRTLTIGTAPSERSIDLVGWSSMGSGGARVACLLVSEEPQNVDRSELIQAVERARVARELHDGLAQDLWLAKLAGLGLERNPSLDSDARLLCADLLRAIEAALSEARTAVMAMRAVDVPSPPLSELITRQVNEFSDRFGIRAESHVVDAPPIPPRVAIEVLRVVQEALNNVRKHARPARAMVRLEERRGTLVLSVRDDGIGFDPATQSSGYGRESMHERAQSIGGRLTIASAPGRGTSVTLRVPMAQFGRTR